MAEEIESVRKDSASRDLKQKEVIDWSGKRVVLPRGTTLPTDGLPDEVFVKQRDSAEDQLFIRDEDLNRWVTIGPDAPSGASTPAFSGARVYHNAAQTFTHNSGAAITFNSERYDTDAYHDAGTPTRLTVPDTGYYLITGHIMWEADSDGRRILGIRVDGSTVIAETRMIGLYGSGFSDVSMSVATVYYLTAGQYVELTAFQDAGGDLDIDASGNKSPEFSISKLGE